MSAGIERPSLARTHTRTSEANRKANLDEGIRVIVDGDSFEVRIGDVTPALAAELRKHTGHSFFWLMNAVGEDPDIDVLSSFEWLARRVRGEEVEFADVAFSYLDVLSEAFDVEQAGPRKPEVDESGDEVLDPQT